MKQKIIRFIVAVVLYGGLYGIGMYLFFKKEYSLNSILVQTLFFGFGMAIFDLLILPKIIKKKNES